MTSPRGFLKPLHRHPFPLPFCTGNRPRLDTRAPSFGRSVFYAGFAFQIEELIRRTSQTLQLLIEHDPVSQRLDRLRLDSRLPAHLKKTPSPHSNATLDLKENREGTLRRRSLRYLVSEPRRQQNPQWSDDPSLPHNLPHKSNLCWT